MDVSLHYCTVGHRDQLPQLLCLLEDLWSVCDQDWTLTVYTDDLMVERILRQIPRPRLQIARVDLGIPNGLNPLQVLTQHRKDYPHDAVAYLDAHLHLLQSPHRTNDTQAHAWCPQQTVRYWYLPPGHTTAESTHPVHSNTWLTLSDTLRTQDFTAVVGLLTEGCDSQATDIFTIAHRDTVTKEALTGPLYTYVTALNRAWVWILGCEPGYPVTPPPDSGGPLIWFGFGAAKEWLAAQPLHTVHNDALWCIAAARPVSGSLGLSPPQSGPYPQHFETDHVSADQRPVIVSAIVSTYNAEHHFAGCLEDLIQQTLFRVGQLEIIIVDSQSMENEQAIAMEYLHRYPNIRYVRTPHREGVYLAWNRGIELARGRYITNANTDDRHHPNALAVMAKTLDDRPNIGLVYGQCYTTTLMNDTWDTHTPAHLIDPIVVTRNTLAQINSVGPQPMWRKALHAQTGLFDSRYTVAGDYELWLRMLMYTEFHKINGATGIYYQCDESVEHSNQHRCTTESHSIALNWRHWCTEAWTENASPVTPLRP